mmetsp:Transcript_13365/g.28996  ORF Transcript_13365/g.28996 Transcript_13365/m.28996 type:complete len:397 (-) Transcript_13365:1671-2861(-)
MAGGVATGVPKVSRSGRIISKPDTNSLYDPSGSKSASGAGTRKGKARNAPKICATRKKVAPPAPSPGSSVSSDLQIARSRVAAVTAAQPAALGNSANGLAPKKAGAASAPRAKPRDTAARSRSKSHGLKKRARVVPVDSANLFSDEEDEFSDFVQRNFELKPVAEPLQNEVLPPDPIPSRPMDKPDRSSLHVPESGSGALIHSQVRLAEIPFWNLQHRKLIQVQVDAPVLARDVALFCQESGRPTTDRRNETAAVGQEKGTLPCSKQDLASGWSEPYPFRLFGSIDGLPSCDVSRPPHLRAGAAASLPSRLEKKRKMELSRDSNKRWDLRTGVAAVRRQENESDGAAVERREHARRFTPHTTRKGWVVCRECRLDVWPPNCRKHVSLCPGAPESKS